MNMVKKLFSLCLALTLLLSLAVPAMAEGEVTNPAPDPHTQHKITIQNTDSNRKYTAYQIFAGSVQIKTSTVNNVTTTDKVLTSIKWGVDVNPAKTVDGKNLLQALQDPTMNPGSHHLYTTIQGVTSGEGEETITWDMVAADIADALGKNESVAYGIDFADVVSKYLKSETPTNTVQISKYENGEHVIKPLSDGYYMVKDTTPKANLAANEVRSLFMMQLVEDSIATPKPSSVSIMKRIVEGTERTVHDVDSSGDVVKFAIRGTVPGRIDSYPSFYYSIEDTMSEGFTLVENSIKVSIFNNSQERPLESGDLGTLYTVASSVGTDKKTNITVTIPDLIALDNSPNYTIQGSSYIVVTYDAKLNNEANLGKTGNKNSVKLTYTEDPHKPAETDTTLEEVVDVYTFGLDVTKIDGSTNEQLDGAEFVLYRSRGGHHEHALVDTSGFVTEWVTDELDTLKAQYDTLSAKENPTPDEVNEKNALADKIAAMTLKSATVNGVKGKLFIKGLDEDTYWLKEITPPVGYQLLPEPYQFQIDATIEENVTQADNTIKSYDVTGLQLIPRAGTEVPGNPTTGYVSVSIVNNPGHTLPETGGIGTTIFYVAGGILAVGALVLLITRKRMYE